ncbi:unnamed protein product [Angiostrongylus costaricensis]|uniref:Gag-pol polyprotein n=1 Tax=Angiostrongylus costaricensis TaxID=334426 RepID=A0A0R3PK15_ANGCS|nr:unnamed protein product [Angiostrongylus costaricensis]
MNASKKSMIRKSPENSAQKNGAEDNFNERATKEKFVSSISKDCAHEVKEILVISFSDESVIEVTERSWVMSASYEDVNEETLSNVEGDTGRQLFGSKRY